MYQTKLNKMYLNLNYRINDWFQHFSRNVREILDNQYPQRWIGRGGPPSLACQVSKSESFIGGPINSEADLRVRIQEALLQLLKK
jgi:hypothetical protein